MTNKKHADLHTTGSVEAPATAAQLIAETAREADRRNGFSRIAIAGGSAVAVLRPLIWQLGSDLWSRVRLTWVDERCVGVCEPESNRGAARKASLGAFPPGLQLALWDDGETPDQALARVRAGLRHAFGGGLDAALLGMGPDGHIASLFPGRAVQGDMAAYVPDSPKPPERRITLTRSILATARRSVVFALGEGKYEAIERLVDGDPALPATGLPGLAIVTDLIVINPDAPRITMFDDT